MERQSQAWRPSSLDRRAQASVPARKGCNRVAVWLRDPETLKLALHSMLTGVMAWLSVAFALPGDMVSNPSFAGFAALATDGEWAGLFSLAALVGLAGLLTRRRWVRLLSIGGLSTAHGSLAYLFCIGHLMVPDAPLSTGVGVYGLIAAMGYLLLWVRAFER